MLGSWKPLICLVLIAVLAAAAKPAVADPLPDANAAEARGDFTAAVSLYRTLAEKGNVAAQIFEIGAGVERDVIQQSRGGRRRRRRGGAGPNRTKLGSDESRRQSGDLRAGRKGGQDGQSARAI